MCFGGNQAPAIQQPQVIYRGPSDDDIRRQEEGLATFQQQMTDQSNAFNTQLQSQIDAANQQYTDLETQFANEIGGVQNQANQTIVEAQGHSDFAAAAANQATNQAATAQGAANTAILDARVARDDASKKGAADLAAAQTAGQFEQAGAYQVATVESDPVNTQETAAITKKKKKDTGLKISPAAEAAAAGIGLNIGV